MAANKLIKSGDKYDNNLFQSKWLSDVCSSSLCSQWATLLPFSKYLQPMYPVDPTSVHKGLNFCILADDGTGIGFLHNASLKQDE